VSSRTTRPPARTPRARKTSTRPEPTGPDTTTGRRRNRTVKQFCDEWEISRSTFYDWRAKGRAPHCIKLPNGDLRITPADYDTWLATCREAD
jgi:predicted DNA-binding transcriptional regulator AlpA